MSAAASEPGVDHSPTRTSAAIALGCALVGAMLLTPVVLIVPGLAGAALLGLGAVRGSRRRVHTGAFVLLGCVLLGGALDSAPLALPVTTLLTLVAWDAGRYGIALGEQLGREADTRGIELAHSALSASVGVLGIGLAYAAFRVVSDGQPVAALASLLVGAALLVRSLR